MWREEVVLFSLEEAGSYSRLWILAAEMKAAATDCLPSSLGIIPPFHKNGVDLHRRDAMWELPLPSGTNNVGRLSQ